MLKIIEADNLYVLLELKKHIKADLIYIDPPFNTGKVQSLKQQKNGKKTGVENSYNDKFSSPEDFLDKFLRPRLEAAYDLLSPTGSLFFHIDYRESHYCKILLDKIFGRASFMNEIIWAYDYGARSKSRWSAKHDNIFWYAKNPKEYTYNYEEIDRIPYMAPGLVGKEKAERGKTPTDVWWSTIVPTNGTERVNYPSQKPRKIIDRIVKVHSNPGNLLLDFFAGSGTFGESAATFGRDCILIDQNPQAVNIMEKRLAPFQPEVYRCPVPLAASEHPSQFPMMDVLLN